MDLQALYDQAVAARKNGNLAEAERRYREILAVSQPPELLVNYANVLSALNRKGEALKAYDAALAQRAGFFEGEFNRANLLMELGRLDEALAGFERAVAARADVPAAWNNRGAVLRQLHRLDAALASHDKALALAPGHVNAQINRGLVLKELGRTKEAEDAAQAALTLQPDATEALNLKATLALEAGRADAAIADFQRLLAAMPQHPTALNGLARAAALACDWKTVAEITPRLLDAARYGAALVQPMVLMGYSDDPALLRRAAENTLARTVPPHATLAPAPRHDHDRIRIAYVSADFHNHPTAALAAELFEAHDREQFTVIGISCGPDDGSPMRARLVRAFDEFQDVRGQSDREAAEMMRALEIDIAVDFGGHTMNNRPGILSWKPAPVQASWLVYPGTTGAPFIDAILADRIVLPHDQQPFFAERIVHLPDCYQVNDSTRAIGPAPSRAEAGLPADGFVFCCFNGHWKIIQPVFDIWMRLLDQTPGSVLWLMDGPGADNLRAAAKARGIDPARLVFAPHKPAEDHLARHALADMFLDTLPYNAHTTASDALWAGLPVLTCKGAIFPGRVGASLLSAAGLPELVTDSPEAYEAKALELAKDGALLKAHRTKLAENLRSAPLFDTARFRKGLEATLKGLVDAAKRGSTGP
ncbi:MAG: tetratricopeptide repeat protein [Alphaproteobacteria bacterium]|nr:tetratricopeptide repeat protein [Alphaproteobacteria bacterium]